MREYTVYATRWGQRQGQGTNTGRAPRSRPEFSLCGPNPFARFFFLEAVERSVPAAFRELAAIQPLDSAGLQAWAQRRGFTDDWALRAAEGLMTLRREDPASTVVPPSGVAAWAPVFPAGPSWDPTKEPEAAFRQRIEKYIASIKGTPGIRRTPLKKNSPIHFDWLALHHVDGWTYDRLLARYQDESGRPELPAISRAVTETADLIGLTLRPGRGRKLTRRRDTPTQ